MEARRLWFFVLLGLILFAQCCEGRRGRSRQRGYEERKGKKRPEPVDLPIESNQVKRPVVGVAARETIFNIEAFGADPTGRADSTYAIRLAIGNATAVGGGIVYIPPGNFLVTQTITIQNTAIQIQGATAQSSVLLSAFGSPQWILYFHTARGVVLSNFGVAARSGSATTYGIWFYDSFLVNVYNVQITSCAIGMWIDNTGNLDIYGVNIWGYSMVGLRMQYTDGDDFFSNIHANMGPASYGIGIHLSVTSGAKFSNCDIIGGQYGMYIDLSPGGYPLPPPPKEVQFNETARKDKRWEGNSWLQFTSVDCDTVSADPWHVVAARGMQMSECWSGSFLSGTGIWIGPDVTGLSISNHQWEAGYVGVGNNGEYVSIMGGLMGPMSHMQIASSVAGEPTVTGLRYTNS